MTVKRTNPLEVLNSEPWAFLLYGEPKIGKTTLAGTFPGVKFVSCPVQEATSLAALPNARSIEVFGVDNWEDFCKVSLSLAKKPRSEDFQTLAIDTLSFAQQLALNAWIEKNPGYKISQDTWTQINRRMVDILDSVMLANRDKNLILITHSRVTVIGEGQGAEKDIGPDFGSSLKGKIEGRLSGIFYLRVSGKNRVLEVEPRKGIDVGSRYRLKGNLTNPTAYDIISMLETYKKEVNTNGS